jgi:hypothetical protein
MTQLTQEKIDAAIQKIQAKAAFDMEFRKEILSDPQKAIERVGGIVVPAGFNIKVIENQPGIDQTFVLPDFQGGALSDNDLANVAGGGTDVCLSHKGGH